MSTTQSNPRCRFGRSHTWLAHPIYSDVHRCTDCGRFSDERDEPQGTAEQAWLHGDDVFRQVIRVNDQRWEGRYCVLVPDHVVVGRWNTLASFKSVRQAEAFAAGYCAHRDAKKPF